MVIGFRTFLPFPSLSSTRLTNLARLSKISCLRDLSSRDRGEKITELIIAFSGSRWLGHFLCALRLPYLISNMKQPGERAAKNKKCAHNRINFNDQWAFAFLFFLKKSYFAYKNTRNQLVWPRERKCCATLHGFFSLLAARLIDFFISLRCSFLFSVCSESLKLYKSVFYRSLYRLLMPFASEHNKKRRICKSHKLWLKLPLCNCNEKRFANRSLITDKAKALFALNKRKGIDG